MSVPQWPPNSWNRNMIWKREKIQKNEEKKFAAYFRKFSGNLLNLRRQDRGTVPEAEELPDTTGSSESELWSAISYFHNILYVKEVFSNFHGILAISKLTRFLGHPVYSYCLNQKHLLLNQFPYLTSPWPVWEGFVAIIWYSGADTGFQSGGGRDFLGTKLFSGIRNKIQEKRYKTHKV